LGNKFVNSSAQDESDFEEEFSEDKKRFAANMFGSDFDIDLISNKDKEETMHILQEKSFRGLFLRLQFWINQICKSLANNGEVKPEFKIPIVHQIIMKSIICFLSYMRDVVFDLKNKKIDSNEHYEWQK
jgi:hypothetical protein